jgi:hypothetical protein
MSAQPYFGLYCNQCDAYARRPDGEVYFYPAPELANGHLKTDIAENAGKYPLHSYRVQEFGKEEHVGAKQGEQVCRVLSMYLTNP